MAFFEDGSLTRSVFEASARKQDVTFGKAGAWIDARPEADEISTQLMTLEAQALETGASMGMGISYPVTLDILIDWTQGLEAKGIVLAPASHFAKLSTAASGQVRIAALDPQG
ncbi:MAG: divergent polysaccharide deacetylase family protein [Henriciella sp.]|nr:divergent polysaccharide deacetylase family protein [Henriciella sp.]